jgi:hypothetical protein
MTTEDIDALKAALLLVANSEEIGQICENENYHSFQGYCEELASGLHHHKFDGEIYREDTDTWTSCSVQGCWVQKYEDLS